LPHDEIYCKSIVLSVTADESVPLACQPLSYAHTSKNMQRVLSMNHRDRGATARRFFVFRRWRFSSKPRVDVHLVTSWWWRQFPSVGTGSSESVVTIGPRVQRVGVHGDDAGPRRNAWWVLDVLLSTVTAATCDTNDNDLVQPAPHDKR